MRSSLAVRALAGLTLSVTTVSIALVATAPSAAAACSDVEVVFARGTGEPAGLGIVGRPFVRALTSALSDRTVSSYAVDYAANTSQSSAGPGATDMSNRISSVAAACPGTSFVIGGYSQGATVTTNAVGVGSAGTPVPAALAPRVKAVVVFGNPLGLRRQTIASASAVYGPKSRDYCNSSDSVCGRYQPTGSGGHTSYASNGSTTQGANFAANLVRTSGPAPTPTTPAPTPTTPAPTTPAPTPTPAPAPTSPAGTCIRASTTAHVDAGRAYERFDRAYARGTNDALGSESRFNYVSLRSTGTDVWARVSSC